MTPSNELFELIKSLSQSEKRFFKVYASRHIIGKKNTYSKLFDAIGKQEVYDEEKIIKKFKGQKFATYFASEKNYLYNMVLDSLNAYHSESSIDYTLGRLLHFSEILFKKSLYEQCGKILERAEKIARKYEQFFDLQKILSKKRKLIYLNPSIKDKDEERLIEDTFIEQEKVLKLQKNTYEFDQLSQTIFTIYKKLGTVRKDEDLEKIKKIIKNPLLKDETEALSYEALRYFYGCHIFYNDVIRDDERNFDYSAKLITHIENNPERKEENLENYIASLNGFLITCIRLKKLTDFATTIDKLKELKMLDKVKRSPNLQLRIFEAIVTNEIDLDIKTSDFEKALLLIPGIEKEMRLLGEGIGKAHQVMIYQNIVAVYFGAGKYREALRWLNRILNESPENIREDTVSFARIIHLVIYFELNNILQLPYLLKSTFRYLSKRKRIYKFEGIVFKYMGEFLRTNNASVFPDIFKRLRNDLAAIQSDPYESVMFEDINLISWLDKKIETLQKNKKK